MHFKWKGEKFVLKLLVGQNLNFTIAYGSKITNSFQFMFFLMSNPHFYSNVIINGCE